MFNGAGMSLTHTQTTHRKAVSKYRNMIGKLVKQKLGM
jgi:hypothetical protein